jgi:transposase-like protein
MPNSLSNFARGFPWNTRRERAAALIANGQYTHKQIAAQLKIGTSTLTQWKQQPAFQARIQEHVEIWRQRIMQTGIADRARRVEALDDRWNKMKAVIAERGADPSLANAPGGKTGLVVRQVKLIGSGKEAELIDEFAVDVALLREMRAHEEQAAKELGQWVEKREDSFKGTTWADLAREAFLTPGAEISASVTISAPTNDDANGTALTDGSGT